MNLLFTGELNVRCRDLLKDPNQEIVEQLNRRVLVRC